MERRRLDKELAKTSLSCLDVSGDQETGTETRQRSARGAGSAEEHHSHHGGCMEMLQSRGSGD